MRILELEIENVRGIRKKITLTPKGDNAVIYGPNGTGKSAVVDAVDFLFTGDISRLAGRGSKGMSLKEHGSHIDVKPKDSVVKAKIEIDGIDQPIILERKMSKPKELVFPEIDEKLFHDTLEIAQKGQHVLSRSEILKFIAAEAGKRADEIQAILNLDMVEDLRKTLVTIKREADRSLQTGKANYETSISSITTTIDLDTFSEEAILKRANDCRKTLKGTPVDSLNPEKLKDGLDPPSQETKERIRPDHLKRVLSAIDELLETKGAGTYTAENELRQTIRKLIEDKELKRALESKRLLDIGVSLIDESGSCPLCLTKWEPGKLEEFLKQRQSKAQTAEEAEKHIQELATRIDTEVSKLKGHTATAAGISKKLKQEVAAKDIEEWAKRLDEWSSNLKKAVDEYTTDDANDAIKHFMACDKWKEHSAGLKKIADGLDKVSPEQKAWDDLTALAPILKRYFDEKKEYENSQKFSSRATAASKIYTEAKDRVLENLYKDVNKDFVGYYKFLHGDDENKFFAELKPDGSQLDFKVDFYGRGTHHPRALHSEGHQDSMGLCLFLALNKRICEDKVKLVILDDVVMSIDAGHRRNVCRLLTEQFPDHQFIITTHNRTWARQLNTDGVVKKQNMVEFKGWTVESGPKISESTDAWDEIRKKLDNNEVASAAAQLREHGEFFYESVCSSLQADVCYKGDGRWELGDFLKGAKRALKQHLKAAKTSANSWDKKEDVAKLSETETQVNEIIGRTQSEQWGVNENVHYSKWADFQKEDFLPIVEAFHDLEGAYKCSKCGGLLALNMKGITPTNVKCPCGNVFWNLEKK